MKQMGGKAYPHFLKDGLVKVVRVTEEMRVPAGDGEYDNVVARCHDAGHGIVDLTDAALKR